MDAGTATTPVWRDGMAGLQRRRLVSGVVTTSRREGAARRIGASVDLSYTARGADRGVPRLASAEVGRTILERMQRLSQPFGTRIAIEGGVGVIRVSAQPTTALGLKHEF
jgi:hypothetical protein